MNVQFRGAVRHRAKARIGILGPSGSGKTMTALAIATGLIGESEESIADPQIGRSVESRLFVIDSERGSAEKFAFDPWRFSTIDFREVFTDFAPANYVRAIKAAEQQGAEVIVIDSLSHAWIGTGGALEMVDRVAMRSQTKNNFFAWRDVTPEHNKMVDAIIGSTAHVIVTMRVKTEYVVDVVGGKQVPRKIGLSPIQRDGMEYEFDLVGDLDLEHNLIISKSRMRTFDGRAIPKPGTELGRQINAWLANGPERSPEPSPDHLGQTLQLQKVLGWKSHQVGVLIKEMFGEAASWAELNDSQRAEVVERLREVAARVPKAA